jgi:hypothetical protein
MIQIVLIGVWHAIIRWPIEHIGLWIIVRASSFWYEIGVTRSRIGEIHAVDSSQYGTWVDTLVFPFARLIALLLAEALVGWLCYRLVNRRPRPRWYRFVRYWWQTCIYGTLAVPAMLFIATIAPGQPANDVVNVILAIALCAYFSLTPAVLARRETTARARRLALLCPVCRYSLRGLQSSRCSECGTRVVHSSSGGYEVDRG